MTKEKDYEFTREEFIEWLEEYEVIKIKPIKDILLKVKNKNEL